MTLEKQIFYELLHKGRELKEIGFTKLSRRAYMFGMLWHYATHLADLKIAENTKSYWMNKADGAD